MSDDLDGMSPWCVLLLPLCLFGGMGLLFLFLAFS